MSEELKQAIVWALKQEYPSCGLSGLYARTIAEAYLAHVQLSADLAIRQIIAALPAGEDDR